MTMKVIVQCCPAYRIGMILLVYVVREILLMGLYVHLYWSKILLGFLICHTHTHTHTHTLIWISRFRDTLHYNYLLKSKPVEWYYEQLLTSAHGSQSCWVCVCTSADTVRIDAAVLATLIWAHSCVLVMGAFALKPPWRSSAVTVPPVFPRIDCWCLEVDDWCCGVRNSLLAVIRPTVWARPGISTSWFWWGCIMTAGNHPQPGIISSNSISHIVTWLSK